MEKWRHLYQTLSIIKLSKIATKKHQFKSRAHIVAAHVGYLGWTLEGHNATTSVFSPSTMASGKMSSNKLHNVQKADSYGVKESTQQRQIGSFINVTIKLGAQKTVGEPLLPVNIPVKMLWRRRWTPQKEKHALWATSFQPGIAFIVINAASAPLYFEPSVSPHWQKIKTASAQRYLSMSNRENVSEW